MYFHFQYGNLPVYDHIRAHPRIRKAAAGSGGYPSCPGFLLYLLDGIASLMPGSPGGLISERTTARKKSSFHCSKKALQRVRIKTRKTGMIFGKINQHFPDLSVVFYNA